MRPFTYPFVSFKPGHIAHPYIPITISNPDTNNELDTFALVDSGADECAFPSSYARILGHEITSGRKKMIRTGNGEAVAYGHSSIISVDEFSTGIITVDYLENLDTPLLGVTSFLSRFIITLDYPSQTVTLDPQAIP